MPAKTTAKKTTKKKATTSESVRRRIIGEMEAGRVAVEDAMFLLRQTNNKMSGMVALIWMGFAMSFVAMAMSIWIFYGGK